MALKLHPDLKGGSEEAFKRLGKVKDFLMAGIAAGRTREAEN